jgi:uncharacterized membrane protein YfcA
VFALGIALSALIGVSLGFFGGGGSILTVPLLVYVFGLGPKQAIASSLLIVGVASVSGAIQHWRKGNVRPREGLIFGAAGMLGAYAGGRGGALLDGGLLLLLFAAMMLLTSAAMWRGRASPEDDRGSDRYSPAKLVLQGLAVGGFTGLVGAGGGFLIVPALALWAGLPISAAVGTSLLVIVLKSAAGFVGYSSHVQVDYVLVSWVSAAAIAGSFAGSRLAQRVDPASLRRAFASFVMAMACFVLVREAGLLASTVTPALPGTAPQLAFALVMLVLGVLAGRASKRATQTHAELSLTEGAGI